MKKLKSAGVENADVKVHWDLEEITWVAVSDVQVSNFSYQLASRVHYLTQCNLGRMAWISAQVILTSSTFSL